METTGGDASWLNGKNERHKIRIHNMVISGIIDNNQQEKKWSCASETSSKVYRCKIHSELDNTSPHFACYGKKPRIHHLITFGCDIYPNISPPKKFDNRTQ